MKKTCDTLQLKSIKSFNSFGFQITGGVGNGSVIKVLKIEPKSPAQLSGMLKDDTILSVNTIDLSETCSWRNVQITVAERKLSWAQNL